MMTPREQRKALDTITSMLLDVTDTHLDYQEHASFRTQLDVLVTGLPGMVRGLAAEADRDEAVRRAVQQIMERSPLPGD